MFKNATSKPKFLKKEEHVPVETRGATLKVEEPKVEPKVEEPKLEMKVEKVKKPKRKCSEKQLLRLEKMRKRKAEINEMKRELKQLKLEKQSKIEVEKLEEQLKTIKGTPIIVAPSVPKDKIVQKEVKIVEPKSILKKEVKQNNNKLATAPTGLDYDMLSEKIYHRLIRSIKKPPTPQPKVVKKVVKQERRGRVAPLSRPTPTPPVSTAPTVRRTQPRILTNNDNLFSNYLRTRKHNKKRGWV